MGILSPSHVVLGMQVIVYFFLRTRAVSFKKSTIILFISRRVQKSIPASKKKTADSSFRFFVVLLIMSISNYLEWLWKELHVPISLVAHQKSRASDDKKNKSMIIIRRRAGASK